MTLLLPNDCVKMAVLPPPFDCVAVCYVDTVRVWVSNKKLWHNPDIFKDLHAANQGRFRKRRPKSRNGWSVYLHQPTRRALDTAASYKLKISRADIALDMPLEDAQRIDQCAVQKWGGKRKSLTHGSTIYVSSDPTTTRNMASYSDRHSKVTGQLCGHVEFRFNKIQTTKRYGLYDPATILDVDIADLVCRQIRLMQLDLRKFLKDLEEIARTAKLENSKYRNRRVSCILQQYKDSHRKRAQRVCQTEESTPSFASLEDAVLSMRSQTFYDYLPAFRNALQPLKRHG